MYVNTNFHMTSKCHDQVPTMNKTGTNGNLDRKFHLCVSNYFRDSENHCVMKSSLFWGKFNVIIYKYVAEIR